MMKGISIKAVLIGWIVDFVLEFAGGLVLATALVVYVMYGSNNNHGHFDLPAYTRLSHSPPVLLISIVLGVGGSLIGGFVTGWIASTSRMKNAYALSIVELVFSVAFLPFMQSYPIWFDVLGTVVTVGFTILGGLISQLIFDDKASTNKNIE